MIRKSFLVTLVTAVSLLSASAQQTAKVTSSGIGYLEYLPPGYNSNNNKYPVVISLHGIKEKGTTSTDKARVLADLGKVDNVGLPKYVLQGTKYPFILISPQLKTNYGNWTGDYIMQVLNYVRKNLRVDDRRIYLTGLSLGGFGVWKVAGDYPNVFAAIAPVCPGGNVLSKAGAIAAADLPIWGFHGGSDKVVSSNVTLNMVSAVNARKPNPLAKATIFPGMGHSIWDRAYKETDLLDWMLRQRKGSAPAPVPDEEEDESPEAPSNKVPVVKAGSDRTLVLPANALYLQGSANDPDGKIQSYQWTKVSGNAASLGGVNTAKLHVTNLKEGTYVFRLTATDNDKASRSDDVRVIVKKSTGSKTGDNDKPSSTTNKRPVASAGPDRTITLPTSTVTVKAQASDRDGKIVSYQWVQTYGKSVKLSGAGSSQVRISGLKRGKFIFRLRVKDNDGAIRDDYFKITVVDPKQVADNGNDGHTTDADKLAILVNKS